MNYGPWFWWTTKHLRCQGISNGRCLVHCPGFRGHFTLFWRCHSTNAVPSIAKTELRDSVASLAFNGYKLVAWSRRKGPQCLLALATSKSARENRILAKGAPKAMNQHHLKRSALVARSQFDMLWQLEFVIWRMSPGSKVKWNRRVRFAWINCWLYVRFAVILYPLPTSYPMYLLFVLAIIVACRQMKNNSNNYHIHFMYYNVM